MMNECIINVGSVFCALFKVVVLAVGDSFEGVTVLAEETFFNGVGLDDAYVEIFAVGVESDSFQVTLKLFLRFFKVCAFLHGAFLFNRPFGDG